MKEENTSNLKTDANFEKLRLSAEEFYRSIGSVKCPYFGTEEVSFNAKGIEHLKFKEKRKIRERNDAFMRLKNIHLAPEILKMSRTLQEKHRRKVFVEVKTNTRNETLLKGCIYYGFTAIINDKGVEKRLKVVVRQIDGGEKHFWSIIPFWKSNKELKMHSGDMERD